MMRQMREATKPIMLFTALAFVALMVFEWGMDATGRSAGSVGEIGSVNGDPVMYEAYMAAYRRIYDQVQRSQEGLISTQQNREIEDAAFDEIVTQILIQQALDERGITVSDAEISEAARFSPPDYLRPQFVTEEGQFDMQGYQAFLASLPQEQLLILEGYYRDVIPRGKLLRQVTSGIFVSDADLWRQWRDRNERVAVRYVAFDPEVRYPDSLFTVPDAEIQAYYRAHQEDYEIPARATIRIAVLSKTPTPADTAAALERARNLRAEIVEQGADFAEVARRESADPTSGRLGGELGVVRRGDMTPVFDSVVFAAPVGQVTQPVRTTFGAHLIRVDERWGADSARASHILVPFERTEDSEIALLTLADSLEDMSVTSGLEQAAASVGATFSELEISETFPVVAGAGRIVEGSEWAFEEAEPGDLSPVFETDLAFYALELVSSQPAGVLPLEEVRAVIRARLLLERKMERSREDARQVLERVRQGEGLANAAAAAGLEVRDAGPFTRVDFVQGLGSQNAAIGAAFGTPPGEVSDVVQTANNTFLIEVVDRVPADSTAWRAQIDQQREATLQQLRAQRLDVWLEALRASADIRDRRDEVLRQPGDDEPLPPMMPMGF